MVAKGPTANPRERDGQGDQTSDEKMDVTYVGRKLRICASIPRLRSDVSDNGETSDEDTSLLLSTLSDP